MAEIPLFLTTEMWTTAPASFDGIRAVLHGVMRDYYREPLEIRVSHDAWAEIVRKASVEHFALSSMWDTTPTLLGAPLVVDALCEGVRITFQRESTEMETWADRPRVVSRG